MGKHLQHICKLFSAQESLKMAIKKLQTAPWNASLGFRGCSEHFNSQSLKSQTAYKIHLKLMMLWIASKKLQLAASALSKSCLQIALRVLLPTLSDCFVFVCSVLRADRRQPKASCSAFSQHLLLPFGLTLVWAFCPFGSCGAFWPWPLWAFAPCTSA